MSSLFEAIMLLCFGAAWPVSIYKSWTSKTNKGKSLIFLFIILTGYVSGILFKITGNTDEIIILYVINMSMVGIDILLYFRNKRFDNLSGKRQNI